jgi:hypothetical protein
MTKSPFEGVGIDRRRPSYSGGPPRLAKDPRHARPRQVHVGVGWIPPLLKAPSNDTRPCPDPYKDAPDLHRMDITTPHSPPWGPGRRGPTGDRTLQGKVRWRHEKDRNRLPRGLVQIGDALAAQAAHPDSPSTPGTRVLERSISVLGGYHPSRIPTRTICDRLQIGTKTAPTKPEWMSGSRDARRGAPGRRGPPNHRIL